MARTRSGSTVLKLITGVCGVITGLWVAYSAWIVANPAIDLVRQTVVTVRLLGADGPDGMVGAPGLTYSGPVGGLLALAQVGLVVFAYAVSWRRPVAIRRLGLVILAGWSLLWLADSLWMESLSDWRHPSVTSGLGAAALASVFWLGFRWPAGRIR